MRRRLTVLCALAGLACGGAPGPQTVSPQSMNQTLDQFFAAVKANDLQRMGALWGTERGPANDWMKSDELRQRLTVIQRYLAHVGYRVIEGPLVVPGNSSQRSFRVELQRPSTVFHSQNRLPCRDAAENGDFDHLVQRSGGSAPQPVERGDTA